MEINEKSTLEEMNQALKRFNIESVNLLVKEFIELLNWTSDIHEVAIIIDEWINSKLDYEGNSGICKEEFFEMRKVRNLFFKLSNPDYFKNL